LFELAGRVARTAQLFSMLPAWKEHSTVSSISDTTKACFSASESFFAAA
jgi:hypothetical protein